MDLQAVRAFVRFGMPIEDPEQRRRGRVTGVLVDPAERRVRYLACRTGLLLGAKTWYVPLEQAEVRPHTVILTDGAQPARERPAGLLLWQGSTRLMPQGGTGTWAGLWGVAWHRESGALMGLIALRGRLRRERYLVPAEMVGGVGSERVTLRAGLPDLARLPVFRTDLELEEDVRAALYGSDLPYEERAGVRLTVVDGRAVLRGNCRTASGRRRIEEAVRAVPGVLEVANHLVDDPELEIAVAQALARDEATRHARIVVRSRLGHVRLLGEVAAADVIEAAVRAARAVPGVRDVTPELSVRPEAGAGRPTEPERVAA